MIGTKLRSKILTSDKKFNSIENNTDWVQKQVVTTYNIADHCWSKNIYFKIVFVYLKVPRRDG